MNDMRAICGYCHHPGVHATEHGPNDEEPTFCPQCVQCWQVGTPDPWYPSAAVVRVEDLHHLAKMLQAAAAAENVGLNTDVTTDSAGDPVILASSDHAKKVAIYTPIDWSDNRAALLGK